MSAIPPDIPLVGPGALLSVNPSAIDSVTSQIIQYNPDLPLNIPFIPSDIPLVRTGGLLSIDSSLTWMIIQFAATIAALGAIDSLLTSVIADNITKTKHNSHRELIGQGIGNVASGLIGGLPGAGATMRTIVNVHAGGKTRLSGLIHGLCFLLYYLAWASMPLTFQCVFLQVFLLRLVLGSLIIIRGCAICLTCRELTP